MIRPFQPRPRTAGCLLAGFLLAAAAVAQLPEHPAISSAETPRWVAVQKLASPPVDAGSEVRYLLVDQQIRLPESGEQQVYRRFTYRLESRTALESWSSWQIDFEPSFERLLVHEVRVERDGRWHDRLQRSRASLLQREEGLEQQIYDERRTLLLVFDDIRVGDTVDISYSILGANPLFDGRFHYSSWLGWATPVARCHLRLTHPESRTLAVRAHAGAPEPVRRSRRGVHVITWSLENLESIETEEGTPSSSLSFPLVEMSEYQDWQEVVDWALPLYLTGPSPALDKLVEQIATSTEDPWQRLVAARNWVQDEVRYFAALMGSHSHAPHAPADILARRYGDCKDKSILLVHLLQRLGIDAWPALVHTQLGPALDMRLPSPAAFDHAIVVADAGGRKAWIDATLSLQGGAEALFVPAYGFGLEIRPGITELSAIDIPPAAIPATEVSYAYAYQDPQQPVEVEIVTRYLGGQAESMRRTIGSTPAAELLESYVDYYSNEQFTPKATSDLEIEDDRAANALSITERYRVTFKDPSGEADFSIMPLLLENDLTVPDLTETRRTPFALPYPLRRDETVILKTPDAETYSEVVAEEVNEWFRFTVTSTRAPGEMHLRYQLETLAAAVLPGDLPKYNEALERMFSQLGYSVWGNSMKGDIQYLPHALLAYSAALGVLLAYIGLMVAFLYYRRVLGRS